HPRDMSKPEIEAFLSHLAVDRDVSASTQRQAHNAIIFLYDQVINIPVSEVSDDGKFLSLFSLLFLLKEWQYQYQM
ncbi:MAG: phage integrase N-terminal SAM-like domain-containing protein, partial [Candidatus Marinimicrobia bacterium]|nr:phage integrase N-terminal SAM-like domain-containing protein [Candidatus Neomarinimicrobiota bacterium]